MQRSLCLIGLVLALSSCSDSGEPGSPASAPQSPSQPREDAERPVATTTPSLESTQPSGESSLRLLMIGVDGADWQILRPLMEEGACPHFAALARDSSVGSLDSPAPRISPILWTGMMTGRQPEEHGVLDFLEPTEDGGVQPITSRPRKVDAVWNILSDRGIRAATIAFWATWPAEPVNGIIVSDAFAPSLITNEASVRSSALVFPPDWDERLGRLREASAPVEPWMGRFVKGGGAAPAAPAESAGSELIESDPVAHLARILQSTHIYHQAALQILDEGDVDAAFVYYQMIDEVCHRFMPYAPPAPPWVDAAGAERFGGAVRAAYILQDELLGELMERVDDRTAVVVVSDHGFMNGRGRLRSDPSDFEGQVAAWHRDEAIVMIKMPGMERQTLKGSVLDVAATVLGILGVEGAVPGTALAGIGPSLPARPPDEAVAAALTRDLEPAPASEARLAELEALGYVGGAPTATEQTANAWANLGQSYMVRNKRGEAEAAYREALEQVPTHPAALYALASLLQESGRGGEARPILVRLARVDASLPLGSLMRLVTSSIKNKEALIETRDLLLARPPKYRDGEWHTAMGTLLYRAEPRAARDEFKRAVELGTELPQPILYLLLLSRTGAQRTEAVQLAREGIQRLQTTLALESLGQALRSQRETELAALVEARLRGR